MCPIASFGSLAICACGIPRSMYLRSEKYTEPVATLVRVWGGTHTEEEREDARSFEPWMTSTGSEAGIADSFLRTSYDAIVPTCLAGDSVWGVSAVSHSGDEGRAHRSSCPVDGCTRIRGPVGRSMPCSIGARTKRINTGD